jgi:hypothetical protein
MTIMNPFTTFYGSRAKEICIDHTNEECGIIFDKTQKKGYFDELSIAKKKNDNILTNYRSQRPSNCSHCCIGCPSKFEGKLSIQTIRSH